MTADQEMGYLCSEPLSPETRKALDSAQHSTWQHVLESEPRRCKMQMRPRKSYLFTILSNGLRWGAGQGIDSLIWCLGDYHVSSLSLDIHFSVYIFIINFTASYIHLNSSCDSINILSVFKELSSDIFSEEGTSVEPAGLVQTRPAHRLHSGCWERTFVHNILCQTLEKKDIKGVLFFLGWVVGIERGWPRILLCVWSMELKKKKIII